jgi:hypothetical protein
MNAIGHTHARFKRACVGTNGILERKFLSKTRTVPAGDRVNCHRNACNKMAVFLLFNEFKSAASLL